MLEHYLAFVAEFGGLPLFGPELGLSQARPSFWRRKLSRFLPVVLVPHARS